MNSLQIDSNYKELLSQVKERIRSAQAKAALAVNTSLIDLYWWLGSVIVEKQQEHSWGKGIVEQLALDLGNEFPGISGFSRRNLYDMRRFYLFYNSDSVRQLVAQPEISGKNPENAFVRQLVAQIPWGHQLIVLNKVKDPRAALFYLQKTVENSWSRSLLSGQIEQNLFARQGKAISNFLHTLPSSQALLAQQTLKDPYNFDFLTLESGVEELEIEKQLIAHITRFLLELGKGFAFIGRQYHLEVANKDYYLDLLFYHIHLRCFVVIELKAVEFQPEFTGKLNFYLSAVDDILKKESDNPTIGILLCKGKSHIEVEYSLRDLNKPIGVSDFKFTEVLPDELAKNIPTVKEFEDELGKTDNEII